MGLPFPSRQRTVIANFILSHRRGWALRRREGPATSSQVVDVDPPVFLCLSLDVTMSQAQRPEWLGAVSGPSTRGALAGGALGHDQRTSDPTCHQRGR